jgi:hypothetical protein
MLLKVVDRFHVSTSCDSLHCNPPEESCNESSWFWTEVIRAKEIDSLQPTLAIDA